MAKKDITDLQVLQAQHRYKQNPRGPRGYELLAEETGQPEKVCYQCVERACKRGLLEYGVSPASAWLTAKGKDMLAGATSALTSAPSP